MSPIKARSLTKRFGKVVAVDGVTFSVEPGKVTGFLVVTGPARRRRCG